MKPRFVFGIIALMVWAGSFAQEVKSPSAKLSQNPQDSTEYEVLIIDPQFDQWYLRNFNAAEDRSNEYYHSKNLVAVANWNYFYNTGQYYLIIESYIDYLPHIDYGIEVNRKLFWYFKYVKETFGIKLF